MLKSEFTDISPLPGYVLLKPIPEDKKTGFITAAEPTDKQLSGVVVAVGDDVANEFGTILTCNLKAGDKVIHRAYGHESYKYNGIDYRFVKFLDIVGKINK